MRQSLAARTDPCFVWPTLFGPPEFLSARVPRVSNPGSSLRWANSPDCLFVTADESGKESCVLNFSKIIINSTSPWREQHARTDRPRLSPSVASHRFVFAPRRARPAAIDFLPRRDTFRNHYSGNAAQLLFLMSEKGAGHTKGRGVYWRPALSRPASCNSQVTKWLLVKYVIMYWPNKKKFALRN